MENTSYVKIMHRYKKYCNKIKSSLNFIFQSFGVSSHFLNCNIHISSIFILQHSNGLEDPREVHLSCQVWIQHTCPLTRGREGHICSHDPQLMGPADRPLFAHSSGWLQQPEAKLTSLGTHRSPARHRVQSQKLALALPGITNQGLPPSHGQITSPKNFLSFLLQVAPF